ncbi:MULTISPECIES: host cell division inhibitor Icd-like protein [Hafniaceae]|uniref:host cell division inhibitor Icd-like protein n=1 Tax=Obesumbacterium proteus TaxID=82983 RepID=UPI003119D938
MYVRNPLVWILLCTYVITAYVKKATPQSVTSTTRASDQTVNEVTIMACFKSTQTHPKFQYRFLALNRHDKKAKPCRLSVEATTEHEARRILAPHFILSFAARLPVQEVRHV